MIPLYSLKFMVSYPLWCSEYTYITLQHISFVCLFAYLFILGLRQYQHLLVIYRRSVLLSWMIIQLLSIPSQVTDYLFHMDFWISDERLMAMRLKCPRSIVTEKFRPTQGGSNQRPLEYKPDAISVKLEIASQWSIDQFSILLYAFCTGCYIT